MILIDEEEDEDEDDDDKEDGKVTVGTDTVTPAYDDCRAVVN